MNANKTKLSDFYVERMHAEQSAKSPVTDLKSASAARNKTIHLPSPKSRTGNGEMT